MSEWIISSNVLILAIVTLRAIFKKRISPRLRYGLWMFVLLRLLLPFNIGQTTLSVLNHLSAIEAAVVENAPLILGEEADFTPFEVEITEPYQPAPSPVHNAGEQNRPALSDVLKAVYVLGAALMFAVIVSSNIHFASRLRKSRTDAGKFMGLPVYRSDAVDTPCLFGLLRPAIYLSYDVEDKNCKHVLMHEQAHYLQLDHVWAWLRGLCLVLHWYNPLVWIAATLSKQDGELSCDARVIASLAGDERIGYGETLISLSCARRQLLCAVTPMSSKGKVLKERIEYVAKRPGTLMRSMALVLLIMLIISGCTFTGAKNEEPAVVDKASAPLVSTGGKLLDRDGRELTEENFQYYYDAINVLSDYLESGATVKLTIDLELHQKALDIIESDLDSLGASASSGCLVALDAKTGAPIVIVSKAEAVDPLEVSYMPGSLFMPCTAVTALEVDVIDADYPIECEGVFDRYAQDGFTASCWIHENTGMSHPAETVSTAIRDSCGYYFSVLGNDCGIDDIERVAHTMGLGVPSGIELPSSIGLMPGRETAKSYGMNWHIGHTLESAVGEGLCSFTPMQLAQYCSTIANNGTRYSASILQEIRDSEGAVIYSRSPAVLSQINGLDERDWAAVRSGLDFPIAEDDPIYASMMQELGGWEISGKGASPISAGLMTPRLFMGYAPSDEPQIAVAAVSISTEGYEVADETACNFIAAYKDMM